ncbi:MAG: NifB/NifX family molybdenum-iron cluster-binding protein [Candidatus Korobacteraceae bacterium]
MRIAIPLSDGRLSQHFGHSEQFLFVDTDKEQRSILRRELVPAPEHVSGFLPEWLNANAVTVVIAAGLGSRARDLLTASSMKVVTGVSAVDPETLVAHFLDGTLESGANGCDHSGHSCKD